MQDAGFISLLEQAPLGQVIAATRRRIKQALWAHLVDEGLTPQQYWVLMVLMEHGGHSLHELAQRVWIDDPTACRIVKGLSARGIITSRPAPGRGRRNLIELAPGTEALQARIRAVASRVRGAVEAELEDEEKAQLRAGLLKVIAGMDALEAKAAPRRKAANG